MAPFPLPDLPGLRRLEAWPPAQAPGPCLHTWQAGPVPVRLLGLPPEPTSWLARLEPAASAERRSRAARCRFPLDALRCLAAEALLRHALWEDHGLAAEALVLTPGAAGKPSLASHPHLHFNLSHSGPWVLCAVHHSPVGVDVEAHQPRAPLPAEAVLAPGELRHFQALTGAEAEAFFYRVWTLKESLLKAMGTGLGQDPQGLSLDFQRSEPRATMAGRPLLPFRLQELPMPPGASAALAY